MGRTQREQWQSGNASGSWLQHGEKCDGLVRCLQPRLDHRHRRHQGVGWGVGYWCLDPRGEFRVQWPFDRLRHVNRRDGQHVDAPQSVQLANRRSRNRGYGFGKQDFHHRYGVRNRPSGVVIYADIYWWTWCATFGGDEADDSCVRERSSRVSGTRHLGASAHTCVWLQQWCRHDDNDPCESSFFDHESGQRLLHARRVGWGRYLRRQDL